jgi:hypothetical protein
MFQEDVNRFVVAAGGCRVERGVAFGLVHGCLGVGGHIDDRQAGVVTHDRAQQPLHDALRSTSTRVHDEPRPPPIVGRREQLWILLDEPLDFVLPIERDGCRQGERRAGIDQHSSDIVLTA